VHTPVHTCLDNRPFPTLLERPRPQRVKQSLAAGESGDGDFEFCQFVS
jgi:hypothetical protein